MCVWLVLLIQAISIVNGHPKSSNDPLGQRFAMEPQDQTAIVGSRVTLPCRVIGKQGTLQWTKDDFGLGWHRNLSGFERYTMIGSDEEGDFSLGNFFSFFFSFKAEFRGIRFVLFRILKTVFPFFFEDIYPVMLDDDARYQCQVGPGPQGNFEFLFYFPSSAPHFYNRRLRELY